MKKVIRLENLDCANCASKMERNIKKLDGVISCSIAFMTQRMTLEAEDDRFDEIVELALKECRKVDKEVNFVGI